MKEQIVLLILLLSSVTCESKSICSAETELTITTIDSITFNRLKNESKKYNVDLMRTRLTSQLELQILDTILNYDKNIYAGDWFESYEFMLDYMGIKHREQYMDTVCLSDEEFEFEYYNFKLDRHNDIIATICFTPLEAFTYLSFRLPNDKWETSSMRIPDRLTFISNTGYVAGIGMNDCPDARYINIDFFKIENFNVGDNRMIRKIEGYSSTETPLNDINLFIPYDNSPKSEIGFWYYSKFYLKCLGIKKFPDRYTSTADVYICFDIKQSE